jgi:hypothetical protein
MQSEQVQGEQWAKTVVLMRGLWPRWSVTQEQLVTWRDEFGNLNPEWMREALRIVYARYSSDHPKPSWISKAFREVHAAKTETPTNEADVAEAKRRETMERDQAEREQAAHDQARMRREIAGWSSEDRAHWSGEAARRFQLTMRSSRGEFDADDVDTWSHMVVGFAYSMRGLGDQ